MHHPASTNPFGADRLARLAALQTQFERLTPVAEHLLGVLALAGTTVDHGRLVSSALHAGALGEHGPLPRSGVTGLLNRLRQHELILIGDDGGVECSPLAVDVCLRGIARKNLFMKLLGAARSLLDFKVTFSTRKCTSDEQLLARMRMALYSGNGDEMSLLYHHRTPSDMNSVARCHPGFVLFDNPFDPTWLKVLPPKVQAEVVMEMVNHRVLWLEPCRDIREFLTSGIVAGEIVEPRLFAVRSYLGLLMDEMNARPLPAPRNSSPALECWLEGLGIARSGGIANAAPQLDQARERLGGNRSRHSLFDELSAAIYLLSLWSAEEDRRPAMHDYIGRAVRERPGEARGVYRAIETLTADPVPGRMQDTEVFMPTEDEAPFCSLVGCLTALISTGSMPLERAGTLRVLTARAGENGFAWLAGETRSPSNVPSEDSAWSGRLPRVRGCEHTEGFRPLVASLKPRPPWETAFLALKRLAATAREQPAAEGIHDTRIAWFITTTRGLYEVTRVYPVLQRLRRSGTWTAGRNLTASEFTQSNCIVPRVAAAQDLRIVDLLAKLGEELGEKGVADHRSLLKELAGHPAVFKDTDRDTPITVGTSEPLVELRADDGEIVLKPRPFPQEAPDGGLSEIHIDSSSPNHMHIVTFEPGMRAIASILGPEGIRAPSHAMAPFIEALQGIVPDIQIHTEGECVKHGGIAEGDARIWVRLSRRAEKVKAELLVKPHPGGRFFRPGSGNDSVYEAVDGCYIRVRRDFHKERSSARTVLGRCPVLAKAVAQRTWTGLLADPQTCLDALLELHEMGDEIEILAAKGLGVALFCPRSLRELNMEVGAREDWFALDGTLRIGEGLVLSMKALFELLDKGGTFMPLGDNRFLALTGTLRRRIEELRVFSRTDGHEVRFHPFGADVLEDVGRESAGVKVDKSWEERVRQMREALALCPRTSETFRGDLRPYQRDGFVWMSRLAAIGMGACLADDMGLGKTIQTIAVLADRTPGGPALVVAPTSLCLNWLSEIRRFAPSLAPVVFGRDGRFEVVDAAKPGSVVICSYALLALNAEAFRERHWHTVVLDEAQAIKDRTSLRSRCVKDLRGDMRIGLTGTPIENGLNELWSLFDFLNPGLLGGYEHFRRTCQQPIESGCDEGARNRLKRLIAPFVLRRIKSQVLEELPEKTEITQEVEQSEEEAAFYEALRREALERVASVRGDSGAIGLAVLREITRLRRACCSPELISPGVGIEGSKLEAFGERIDDLIGNGHRALVFSQFVEFLAIVKSFLDKAGVRYEYLDGSTPATRRAEAVDRFQRGDAPVFLLSLKAGGLGLNLTAADYVIHLDPWWNPAVEDQASDRAHRIGQSRRVTVYRLVVAGTIEEKILALHRTKRDLAESLLEGADITGRLSADELLALIRDE